MFSVTTKQARKLKMGARVYWNDPKGENNGYATVEHPLSPSIDGTLWIKMESDGRFAFAYPTELDPARHRN